jgi:PAS domain S-box-containing protein
LKQNLTSATILAVDDTEDSLMLLDRILGRAGYTVLTASSGQKALDMMKTATPDLILLDINMSDVDGFEVCIQLKADKRTRDIPIMFLSAIDGIIDKMRAFDIGGVDYITKPFHFAEVLARVKTHIDVTRLIQQDKQLIQQLSAEIEERQRAEAQIRRLADMLENVSDAIITTDHEFRVLTWNNAAEQIYGWRSAEAVGKTLDDISETLFIDDERANSIKQLKANGHWQGEVTQFHRDGTPVSIYSSVSAVYDEEQQLIGAVGINRDISQQKKAEEHRRERVRAEDRAAFLRDFLGNLSHDLRTPLSTIQTGLYLLERYEDPDQRSRKIRDIETQVGLFDNLISNIITMTRLDTVTQLQTNSVDVNGLLRDVADKLRTAVEKRQHRLELDLAPDVPAITADEGQLFRVFINLLENALLYTPEEGSVTLRSSCNGNAIYIEVSDTGIGIDEADKAQIFERFYRGDKARTIDHDYAGSGLGLAIVKSIIELHRGQVEVDSTPGEGSTFRVRLPLDEPSA